jgi:hypothetical protein
MIKRRLWVKQAGGRMEPGWTDSLCQDCTLKTNTHNSHTCLQLSCPIHPEMLHSTWYIHYGHIHLQNIQGKLKWPTTLKKIRDEILQFEYTRLTWSACAYVDHKRVMNEWWDGSLNFTMQHLQSRRLLLQKDHFPVTKRLNPQESQFYPWNPVRTTSTDQLDKPL